MIERTIAIIGGTGLVGQSIVSMALAAGHRVIAVSHIAETLVPLAATHKDEDRLITLQGSLADDAASAKLAHQLAQAKTDTIVIAVNGAYDPKPLAALEMEDLQRVFQYNLVLHLAAARHLLPILPEDGMFLGIGGGMADLVLPGQAAMSMNQSAQRTLYRYLAKENAKRPVQVRELMIFSMVTPGDQVIESEPHRISAEEVGRHVCAILADPATFEGPILSLKSKKQVGQPEKTA